MRILVAACSPPLLYEMESLLYNSHSGYLEGVLRGFKAGLLTQNQYSNLTQCETIDGQSPSSHRPRAPPPSSGLVRSRDSVLNRANAEITREIDFKLQISSTDYANFLANEQPPISTSTIAEKATKKMVDEFNYIRDNSVQPLTKFLDYMT